MELSLSRYAGQMKTAAGINQLNDFHSLFAHSTWKNDHADRIVVRITRSPMKNRG
jgi:hypothetical protein